MTYSFDDLYWEREKRRCARGPDGDDPFEGFVWFAEHYVWIEHPKGKRLLKLRDAQLETAKAFFDHEQVLILKARQIGFTTLTMAFALWSALFHESWSCINLSRREDDAEAALGKALFAYDWLRPELKARLPQRLDRGSTRMTFTNGSKVESHPSRGNPARGRTVSLILVDEWAFFENAEEAWSSIKPTFDIGGRIIALSTANGAGTLFHEMWVGATTNSNSFFPVFFPWSAVPERDQAWYEQQKRDMLTWQLHQEYPRDDTECFLKAGNPVFDVDRLLAIETVEPERGYLVELGSRHYGFRPAEGAELSVWQHPIDGVVYAIGADIAEGLEHGDYSVAWVINTATMKAVAKWRGHIDPDLFGSIILKQLGFYYNGCLIGPEVNASGYTTCVALRDAGYPHVYYRRAYDERTGKQTSKIGWRTQMNTKPFAIDSLAALLRTGELQLLDKETIAELTTFVRDPDGKMHGSPFDDSVMALAIAVVMCRHASTSASAVPKSDYMTAGWLLREVMQDAKRGRAAEGKLGAANVRKVHEVA